MGPKGRAGLGSGNAEGAALESEPHTGGAAQEDSPEGEQAGEIREQRGRAGGRQLVVG